MTLGLVEALRLPPAGGVVSIVGGGGKSALLFALGRELPGRVLLTTTTRIFTAQLRRSPIALSTAELGWRDAVANVAKFSLLVGEIEGEQAKGIPVELVPELVAFTGVDHIVIEADGSRMRPVKAPADHEPVVPPSTTHLVVVAGIDALRGPIAEVAHRPERVSAVTELRQDAKLSPEALGLLLAHPKGGLKSLPDDAHAVVLLNKVETPAEIADARLVARTALATGRVSRVVIGALEPRRGRPGGWEIVEG